jgi:hypothetical protein
VSQHVRVRLEGQLGLPARALDHAGETSGAERCSTFRGEPARTPRPPTPPKVALNGSAQILPSNTPGTPSAHGNWRARDDSNVRPLPQEPPPISNRAKSAPLPLAGVSSIEADRRP